MSACPVEGLEVLESSECWRLLRTHSVGRFVANRPGLSPYIVPVNFAVDEDDVLVIRTDPGPKLDLVANDLVVLEVDEIDPVHHVGWSVVVEGLGTAQAASSADLKRETWAPGTKLLALRIVPVRINGRRIRLHTPPTDERGYR